MADLLDSLSASQRDTLASFQSITATEDLTTASTILESTGWDLTVSWILLSYTNARADPHVALILPGCHHQDLRPGTWSRSKQ